MRGGVGIYAFLIAAAFAANGAGAMSRTGPSACRVVGGEKLSAGLDEAAICSAVERAIAARAPTADYSVEVSALSQTRLTAKLVVNGKVLPVQNFAVMDRSLSAWSIKNFAESLANVVAQATKA